MSKKDKETADTLPPPAPKRPTIVYDGSDDSAAAACAFDVRFQSTAVGLSFSTNRGTLAIPVGTQITRDDAGQTVLFTPEATNA